MVSESFGWNLSGWQLGGCRKYINSIGLEWESLLSERFNSQKKNMKLLAVSVAKPSVIEYNGKQVMTGIYKVPSSQRINMTKLGLEGDGQADLDAHGGVDKAVYIYSYKNYIYWQDELELSDLPFGQFGENLTVQELSDDSVHIGDRLRIGDALVEVTQPRIPCFKLGVKMGMSNFPRRFMKSGRVGFYVRVLDGAKIGQGDLIERVRQHPKKLSVKHSLLALSSGPEQSRIIRRALEIEELSKAWRNDLTRRLQGGL